MSKIKLYKNSPLNALGQGIHDLLNYQDIKLASGQFDPVGESLFSLGEMFASKSWDGIEFKKKIETPDGKVELAKAREKAEKVIGDVSGENAFADITNPKAQKLELQTSIERTDSVIPPPKPVKKVIEGPQYNDWFSESVGKQNFPSILGTAFDAPTSDPYGPVNENQWSSGGLIPEEDRGIFGLTNSKFTGDRRAFKARQNLLEKEELAKKALANFRAKKSDSPGNRLKDDSPFDRMNPEKLKALKGLMYNTSNGDSPLRRISHMMNSPFLKTDEGPNLEKVDFRYMKRATSTGIGSLGGAASAGYNLAIDAKNYKTAVKQDYDEELSEGMGELVLELEKTNPNYESDMFELASAKKKQYAEGFAAYAKGDIDRLTWENVKLKMKGELENHGKALNTIANLDKSFAEGKGSAFNVGASDPQLTDYYNARMKNPDAFTVKSIDGVDTYVGETLQGKKVSLPISMIANGAAKMQLVPQYDINKAVNQGLKVMKAFTVEGKTALGTGSRNLNPNNPQEAAQLREMAVNAISREIGADETRLRSILADERQLGFNEVEQLLNAKDGSKNENLQELLQQMAEEIYDEKILGQGGYQPESKTRFRAQQTSQGKGSEKERSAAKITKALNNLGPISPDNIDRYSSLLPNDMSILTDEDGIMFLAKGDKRLPGDITKANAKAMIAKATGVKGYGLGNNESNQVTIDLSQSRKQYNY